MKRNFMWHYSVLWLTYGALANFYDFLVVDVESFWAVCIAVPTIIWLFKESK